MSNTNEKLFALLNQMGVQAVGGSLWEVTSKNCFPMIIDGTTAIYAPSKKAINKDGEEFDTTPEIRLMTGNGNEFLPIKLKDGVKYVEGQPLYIAGFTASKDWDERDISKGDPRAFALDAAHVEKYGLEIIDV